MVKCGFIADEEILAIVESDSALVADPTSAALRELVERAVRVKATVVSTDLRESTSHGRDVGREALNYGHTMGHAVERAEQYAFRHGEAVAIGMVYVAELARLAGRLDRGDEPTGIAGSSSLWGSPRATAARPGSSSTTRCASTRSRGVTDCGS